MNPFRPGEFVELRGQKYKIAATNYDGKLILHPASITKESSEDMMMRLQSTVAEPSKVRVEAPKEP